MDQIPRAFVAERCTGKPQGSLRPRVPVVATSQKRGCGSDRLSIGTLGHRISHRVAAILRSVLCPDRLGCSNHPPISGPYSFLKKLPQNVLFLPKNVLSPAIVPITGYKCRYIVMIYARESKF